MNGYTWNAATPRLAERVRKVGPRIALLGAVMLALVAVPLFLRYCMYLPG